MHWCSLKDLIYNSQAFCCQNLLFPGRVQHQSSQFLRKLTCYWKSCLSVQNPQKSLIFHLSFLIMKIRAYFPSPDISFLSTITFIVQLLPRNSFFNGLPTLNPIQFEVVIRKNGRAGDPQLDAQPDGVAPVLLLSEPSRSYDLSWRRQRGFALLSQENQEKTFSVYASLSKKNWYNVGKCYMRHKYVHKKL